MGADDPDRPRFLTISTDNLASSRRHYSLCRIRADRTFVRSFLFEMRPNDPLAIAFAKASLVTAAALASYAPARRAARIDPVTALRDE